MFDPINGPTNHYEGPATGLSTEKGDSWHVAVSKINAGFKKVITAIESPFAASNVAIVDDEARKEIAELRETIASQQIALDAAKQEVEHIEGAASDYAFKVDALERRLESMLTPATPPVAADPVVEPVVEGVEGTASNG